MIVDRHPVPVTKGIANAERHIVEESKIQLESVEKSRAWSRYV